MKCSNCDIKIDAKFKFAIKYNKCPACDKHIMHPETLVSYINLQELIKSNFPDINVEQMANLIVANFELKQLFKSSSLGKQDSPHSDNTSESVSVDISEDMLDKESDEAFKAKQVSESKAILKKMKEDAYEDALRDQYGMGETDPAEDNDGFFGEEDLNPVEFANRLRQDQKQNKSQSGMLSGSGGFSRTDG